MQKATSLIPSKAKSVVMTDESAVRSRELFKKYFAKPEPRASASD
jgi:hypothetical protein